VAQPAHTHLKALLVFAITECSKSNKEPALEHIPPEYDKLISEQTNIGWTQILNGRWSTERVKLFDMDHFVNGEKITTTIITTIWHAILEHWKKRCDKEHDGVDTHMTYTRQHLTQRVNTIYATKPKLDLIDQQPFAQPMAEVMQMPIRSLKD
jgi:hypothetical protein